MNWPQRRLDELGIVSRGRSRHRPRNDPSLYGGTYPFVQTGDVKHADLYITSHTQTYNDAGLAQSRMWPAGTLCITIAANIADTAILSYDACFPDSVIGFIPQDGMADVRFVKYFFSIVQERYRRVAQGAAQDNLNQQKLLSFPIPAPAIQIQRRIADILSAYDDLIENNKRRMALLEESIHLLYREWFVYLRFPGHERVEIVDGVPEGWTKRPMKEFVGTQYGFTASSEKNVVGPQFIRGMDINKAAWIDWSTVPYCEIPEDELDKYRVSVGDVLMIRMADPGKVGIIEQEVDAIFASYLVRLTIRDESVLPYCFFYFLRSAEYQGFITGASTGTTRKSASAKLMTTPSMLVPPIHIQESFEQVAAEMRGQLNLLLQQNRKLRRACDLLLPRLMDGRILV